MKILVLSDSHHQTASMEQIAEEQNPNQIFFLGDGIRDLETLRFICPHASICAVEGNNDRYSQAPQEVITSCGGIRFYLCHGHHLHVKESLYGLIATATRNGAQIALYGHTHTQNMTQTESGLWLFNPGSIGYRDDYGIIEIEPNKPPCLSLHRL